MTNSNQPKQQYPLFDWSDEDAPKVVYFSTRMYETMKHKTPEWLKQLETFGIKVKASPDLKDNYSRTHYKSGRIKIKQIPLGEEVK